MKAIAKNVKGKHIKVVSAVMVCSYTYAAMKYTQNLPVFNTDLKWCKTRKFPNEAKCLAFQHSSNETNEERSRTDEKKKIHTKRNYDSNGPNPPENELRIIIVGATGSGKSSAGNVLLKNDKHNQFKTSCLAKSETRRSSLKTIRTDKYKIDIIDTPASLDIGQTDEDTEIEIQKAIALTSPGPHAFLLCIPATAITKHYINAIKPYEKYFGDRLYDYVIVVFTRCDQRDSRNDETSKHGFMCEISHAVANNSILQKIENILGNMICMTNKRTKNENGKTDDLEKVVDIINKRERKHNSKVEIFASCGLSKRAERLLLENMEKDIKSDLHIPRDTTKTSDRHLAYFSRQFCNYCQMFRGE